MAIDSQVADVLKFDEQFADSFGVLLAKNQQLQVELPSTNSITEERYRLLKNGSRVDFSDPGFADQPATYDLTVGAGDTYRLESRERPRYIPNNDALLSLALRMQDTLQTGDRLTFGQGTDDFDPGAPAGTGWVFVHEGTSTGRTVEHRIVSGGTLQSTLPIDAADIPDITTPARWSDQHNLYNVGGHEARVFYTQTNDDGEDEEVHTNLGVNAVHDEFAVDAFNIQPFYELSIAAGNTTKTLEAGTIAHTPFADVAETAKPKSFRRTDYEGPLASDGTLATGFNTTEYTPFLALRLASGEGHVFVNIFEIRFTPQEAGEVQAKLFYDDEVTFTGGDSWSPGRGLTASETVVRQRRDIESITDEDGNTVSAPVQTIEPGGSQTGFASTATGAVEGGKTRGSAATEVKTPIFGDGIVVLMKKNDGTAGGADMLKLTTIELK